MDGGQVVGNGGTHDQEADGAEAAAQSVPECDAERKEVEYSALDFSACKQKSPTEDTRETTETEYAEIKKEEAEERRDDAAEDGEMLVGNREEEGMMGEDEEQKQCMSEKEEKGEDTAVYSTVDEVMANI